MNSIKQAVILAGGMGTRLRPFTDTAPKPMFLIHGKPFLEYLIEQVKNFGLSDIVLLLGYLPNVIIDHFGSGEKFGVSITYSVTDVSNDTGRRIGLAKQQIEGDFLLMYCDNYCPLDFPKMCTQFYSSGFDIQTTSYNNSDGYTKNNLLIDDNNKVVIYDKRRKTDNLNGVDIGYTLIKKDVLSLITDENYNFEKFIYTDNADKLKIGAFRTEHRYYSVGSYESIKLTKQFFENQKIVFLDRDGTLNVGMPKACYVTNPHEFVWIEGSKEAVKTLNKMGYKVFLITNQAGIARGLFNISDLNKIHEKMTKELEEIGAHIDKIYYCPHGWDDACACRKPDTKMLFDAQKEFNFNMQDAVFIGDDIRDMECAKNAGCKGILVSNSLRLYDCVKNIKN